MGWATCNVPNGGRGLPLDAVLETGKTTMSGERKVQVELHHQTNGWPMQWPTAVVPAGGGTSRSGDRINEPLLDGAARTWPDLWPTCSARDWKGSPKELTRKDGKSRLDQLDRVAENFPSLPPALLPSTHGLNAFYTNRDARQLSPVFSFWHMGWPATVPGGCVLPGMELSRWKARMRSQLYGLVCGFDTSEETVVATEHPILVGPVNKTTTPKELDSEGREWGFQEYAELTTTPGVPIKALHDFAARVSPYVKWFVAEPIPMYRITRQRHLDARRAGAILLTEAEEAELVELWLKKEQEAA